MCNRHRNLAPISGTSFSLYHVSLVMKINMAESNIDNKLVICN